MATAEQVTGYNAQVHAYNDHQTKPAAVGKLTDREGVEVSLPGGGRGALATDPVPYAFLRVASFPFRTQFTDDDEQFTGGAGNGAEGDASRGAGVAVAAPELNAEVCVAGNQAGQDGALLPAGHNRSGG